MKQKNKFKKPVKKISKTKIAVHKLTYSDFIPDGLILPKKNFKIKKADPPCYESLYKDRSWFSFYPITD